MCDTQKTKSFTRFFLKLALIALLCNAGIMNAQSANITIGSMMVDESLITVKNNKLIFDGLTVDQEESGYQIVGIISSANEGNVKIIDGIKIHYSPGINICNKTDVFSYLITNGSVESVKNVTVEILCEPLAIMSSMSPNGDGEQDSFVILGIEKYPKNELVIFNDLGLEIFRRKNYSNDWDGTYQGKTLPAGVYYYVFKPGNGEVISGYLHMGTTT